jgi:hypothetical protein
MRSNLIYVYILDYILILMINIQCVSNIGQVSFIHVTYNIFTYDKLRLPLHLITLPE